MAVWRWGKGGRNGSGSAAGGGAVLARPERDAMPDCDARDGALDALASVLRTLGRHAFDLDGQDGATFERQCDAWSRHVLVGTDAPGAAAPSDGRRDWGGLQRFVLKRRRDEQQYVHRSAADLRQIIWTFVEGFQRVLVEDQRDDEQLASQLRRLSDLNASSSDEVKREVTSAVAALTQLVADRKRRQECRVRELGARVTELRSQLVEARLEGAMDGLTRLYNRRALDEFLAKVVYFRDSFGHTSTLLLIDLDGLKEINDTHGHLAGDAVLRAFADCAVRNFPRRGDVIGRFGGDEFAIVLPDTRLQDGMRLGQRLVAAVRDLRIEHGDVTIGLTTSIGVSEIRQGDTVESWIARADLALYAAKQGGRDRIAEAAA